MVDPHTVAAGTGTLMTVVVFIGSQLSPSIMVRRAVKKELKASALLKENGSILDPKDRARLSNLKKHLERSQLTLEHTTWESIAKHPIKLFLRAHRYHDVADRYLLESRSASAKAVADAALNSTQANANPDNAADEDATASAGQIRTPTEQIAGGDTPTGRWAVGDSTPPPTNQFKGHDQLDTTDALNVRIIDDGAPSYDSTPQIEDAFTTRFDNVVVSAGGCARITLHFGVGDVPVLVTPDNHIADLLASYNGPVILSGCAKLLPNDGYNLNHPPQVFIGHYKSGYDMEFYDICWRSPQDDAAGVSGFMDDDRVSLASLEATYGGDQATIREFDENERR